jgi:putative acetyltransferase
VTEIRRVETDADFARLQGLFAAYEGDLPPELRHGLVPSADALKAASANRNAAFMAMHGGNAVGCIAVRELDADAAVIARLYVKPESRGLGTGRALVLAAIRFIGECGYARAVLDTSKERLTSAYRLYRSLGFHECAAYGQVSYEMPTFMELYVAWNEAVADDRI